MWKTEDTNSEKTNRIAAIVVTYNRLLLLEQCLKKLEEQTVACDILVIDNASADGTELWVTEYCKSHPNVRYQNTGANLGGAGGFNHGIRWAVELGYDYLWLMDDDTLPHPDALEKLLEADEILQGNYGWLSSVVLWTDGTECKMNRQKLKKSFYEYSPLLKHGIVQAEQATFVSLFLKKDTVYKVGNVILQYYIWGDDIEYTRRIAVRNGLPSFACGASQVVHAMKENNGSSIATDSPERLERYRYAFRNEAHLYRQEGIKGICYYLAKCGWNLVRIMRSASDHKLQRCQIIFGGMFRGLRFQPEYRKDGIYQ